MTQKILIVGGGLVGVLAALEAHRLGAREIILHERHPDLGGSLKPRLFHGLELRDQLCLFGDRTDPMRQLLAWRGVRLWSQRSMSTSRTFGKAERPARLLPK